MTLAEAKRILKPPLKFGDPVQIKAVRFLESVDAACEAIKVCEEAEEHLDAIDALTAYDIDDTDSLIEELSQCCTAKHSYDAVVGAIDKIKDE